MTQEFKITQKSWEENLKLNTQMKEKIDQMHETLMGNGRPGLVTSVSNNKSDLDKIKGGYKVLAWFIGSGSLISIIALVRTFLLQ